MIVLFSLLIVSCGDYEDAYSPQLALDPVLSVSSEEVVLNQKQSGETAFTLSWSAGGNDGTNSAINYRIEADVDGGSFDNPVVIDAGKAAYNSHFIVDTFNDLLLNSFLVSGGSEAVIAFRVVSVPLDDRATVRTSNVVKVKIKTYEPVEVPEALYMIGDAAPSGWDSDNPTPMTKSPSIPGVFTYQGELNAGDLKFLTTPGEWLPSYQKGDDDNTLVLRTDFDQPDDKFMIDQAGLYRVTVDVIDMTFQVEALASSPYNELWIIGSAVPKGWDIDDPDAMFQDPSDPFVFYYNGELLAGEMKIATARDYGAPFYRPVSEDQPLTATDIQLSAGDPDYKWVITDPGPYKITLNLRDNTIHIEAFEPFERLWIVGDATPTGWNIDNPTEMTRVDDYVFTWTGQLNAGEFKFPISTGDWGTSFFMPYFADESVSGTSMAFRPPGSPDLKWRVQPGEEGIYTITLDQLRHTISIVKQ